MPEARPLAFLYTRTAFYKRKDYVMKPIKKIFAAGLAVMMALSLPFSVSAAALDDGTTIDESRTGSLTIYKYDLTGAEKDGV